MDRRSCRTISYSIPPHHDTAITAHNPPNAPQPLQYRSAQTTHDMLTSVPAHAYDQAILASPPQTLDETLSQDQATAHHNASHRDNNDRSHVVLALLYQVGDGLLYTLPVVIALLLSLCTLRRMAFRLARYCHQEASTHHSHVYGTPRLSSQKRQSTPKQFLFLYALIHMYRDRLAAYMEIIK